MINLPTSVINRRTKLVVLTVNRVNNKCTFSAILGEVQHVPDSVELVRFYLLYLKVVCPMLAVYIVLPQLTCRQVMNYSSAVQ